MRDGNCSAGYGNGRCGCGTGIKNSIRPPIARNNIRLCLSGGNCSAVYGNGSADAELE